MSVKTNIKGTRGNPGISRREADRIRRDAREQKRKDEQKS